MTSRRTSVRRAVPLAMRFLIAFVAASLLPLLVFGAFQIASSYLVQRAQVEESLQEAAKSAATTIDDYLTQMEDEMTLTAREWSLRAVEVRPSLLDGLLAYNPGFETLTMLDSAGLEVVKVSRYALFGPDDLVSRSDTAEFVFARHGERYLGPVSLSRYGEPLATLSIPVKDVLGDITGVLLAEVNLKYMWDLIARMEIGRGGYAYVVDDQGRLIAHRDSSLVLQGRDLSGLQGVRYAQQGRDISSMYTGLESQEVIGRYQPLQQARWFVFVEAPGRQAMADIYRAAITGVVAVFLALGGAVVLGWYMARIVVRPVRDLQQGAEIIGAGDVTHRIEIQSRDEIGALAGAFNAMAEQLQDTIGTLEQRVTERTHDLEHRAVQLATAADVGRAAASILELETLAQQIVELVRVRFGLYYAGLFLLDDVGQYAVLKAGTGEAGHLMVERGHQLEVGGMSMVGAACAQHQARIALDVGEEPVRFDNPLLPETRSEMALPLIVGDRVLGALDVQSSQSSAFSEEDITVLQLVADQVAVAIDNARKFSEEAALLEATSPLYRVSRRLAAALTTDEIVQAVITSVAETEADGCAVARFDVAGGTGDAGDQPDTVVFLGTWNRVGAPRFPTGIPFPVSASHLPLAMMTTFLAIDDINQETRIPEESRQFLVRSGSQAMVNIPLRVGGPTIGFVIVQRAAPGPFSPVSIRLYETMVEQAAVALERARLLEETQRRAARERLAREIADKMRRAADMDALMKITIQETAAVLGTSGAFVQLATSPDSAGDNGGHPEPQAG
jgi:GAF domain-containing protein/HAMP domain-containing protein